jgi:hypothetical protein
VCGFGRRSQDDRASPWQVMHVEVALYERVMRAKARVSERRCNGRVIGRIKYVPVGAGTTIRTTERSCSFRALPLNVAGLCLWWRFTDECPTRFAKRDKYRREDPPAGLVITLPREHSRAWLSLLLEYSSLEGVISFAGFADVCGRFRTAERQSFGNQSFGSHRYQNSSLLHFPCWLRVGRHMNCSRLKQ